MEGGKKEAKKWKGASRGSWGAQMEQVMSWNNGDEGRGAVSGDM